MILKWTTRRHRLWGIIIFASTTLLILYTFFIPYSKDSIACFDETVIGGIPDVLDDETQLPPKGKSIFFHETSCSFSSEKIISITPRQACAVESAARLNPNFTIYILYTSPIKYPNSSIFVSKNERIIKELRKYNNIKIRRVDLKRYTKDTPLEEWYQTGELQKSQFPNSHASDVLRYLSLWKYGGIYLDLDVVVMKSFDKLGLNYAAAESDDYVAAGLINFDHEGFGHDVANICIKEIKHNFRGNIWGHNGPGVITRALQKICKTKFVKIMKEERCRGFKVLPPSSVYPISWSKWSFYFDPKKIDMVMAQTKDSYAIHVWNKFSRDSIIDTNGADVAYSAIARRFCPNVYRESGNEF